MLGTSPILDANSSSAILNVGSRDSHESVMLKSRVIEATHDITPKVRNDPSVNSEPFMYWHAETRKLCH